jgi:hypothetical protein
MIGFDDELEQGYADSTVGANVSQAELDLLSARVDRLTEQTGAEFERLEKIVKALIKRVEFCEKRLNIIEGGK